MHFGRAVLQRASATAGFEKSCKQKCDAAQRERDQQERRDGCVVHPGQNAGDGDGTYRQRRQPEQHHARARNGQATYPSDVCD